MRFPWTGVVEAAVGGPFGSAFAIPASEVGAAALSARVAIETAPIRVVRKTVPTTAKSVAPPGHHDSQLLDTTSDKPPFDRYYMVLQ